MRGRGRKQAVRRAGRTERMEKKEEVTGPGQGSKMGDEKLLFSLRAVAEVTRGGEGGGAEEETEATLTSKKKKEI